MVVKKSLHHPQDILELRRRIYLLNEKSERRWGKMNPAQMMSHCTKILKIPTGKVAISNPNILFKVIGILTKIEMGILNNRIPRNMPTFESVLCDVDCDFAEMKENLLSELEEYLELYHNKKLPRSHSLFGKMSEEQWGFMEYKHIDHHLKQFGL